MLTLQSEIAHALASEIRVQLTPQEQMRLARLTPINADAYDAYSSPESSTVNAERRVHWPIAEDVMRALFVMGRAIFGGFFAYNGVNHLQHSQGMAQYAAAKGVPAAEQAVQATGALLLAGGLSIMAGIQPRMGLAAIVGFLVPVSLQMHRFWEEHDPQKRQAEMIQFMKNMALVGAALTMMQIKEPWPVSVDEARAADEEMFIRLGGRELRALPA